MSGRGVANEAALVKQIQNRIKKEFPTAWVVKVVGNPYQVSGIPEFTGSARRTPVRLRGEAPENT